MSRVAAALVLLLIRWIGATDCSPECKQADEKRTLLQKSIQRCEEIKQVNLEFIKELDPDQESKRLKANSNVRIAEKRITETQMVLVTLEKLKKSPQCKSCA